MFAIVTIAGQQFKVKQNDELFVHRLEGNSGDKVEFSDILIDRTFKKDNQPTRKPGTAMLSAYINNENYDIKNSFVIGDRITDVQLAKNLGCKAIWLNNDENLGASEIQDFNA